MNMRDYQLYTQTQIKVKEQIVVRTDLDVNEDERLPTLHLDIN